MKSNPIESKRFNPGKDHILCVGCSFTDSTLSIYDDFDIWTKVLADKLNIDYVELGYAGSSFTEISSKATRHISLYNKKIKHVFILWSDFFRYNFCFNKNYSSHVFQSPPDSDQHKKHSDIQDLFYAAINLCLPGTALEESKDYITASDFILYALDEVKKIEALCKYYDLPYLFMQAIDNVPGIISGINCRFKYDKNKKALYTDDITLDTIKNELQRNALNIDTSRFIGWPIVDGVTKLPNTINEHPFTVIKYIIKHNLTISDDDLHPNQEGHKVIADLFYKFI